MCSYPHLQYHFDQYESDCRHRDTPREVHEQRFAGSSFAHHLLQSNTNSQALPLATARSRALSPLPGTAERYRLGVAFSFGISRASPAGASASPLPIRVIAEGVSGILAPSYASAPSFILIRNALHSLVASCDGFSNERRSAFSEPAVVSRPVKRTGVAF